MIRFTAGDRVNYIGTRPDFDKEMRGRSGTVTKDDGGICVGVDWDGDPKWSYGVYRENIKLAKASSPIRTVTKREIVPGIYGIVNLPPDMKISITPKANGYRAEDLRAAAKLFGELADFLDSA